VALAELEPAAGQLVVCFVAPPWGDALDVVAGLDLARTTPPVIEVLRAVKATFAAYPLLFAVQIYERTALRSLAEVSGAFDWSVRRDYPLAAEGRNHGLLIGTVGWAGRLPVE
jgi:hypothetical protein